MKSLINKTSFLVILAMAVVILGALPAKAVVVYSNDFSSSVGTLWSADTGTPIITTAPLSPWEKFLGTDAADGISSNTMTLNLAGLSGYTSATVEFDLYIIQSWDGNNPETGPDRWKLDIGATTYVDTTFSNVTGRVGYNQSYALTNPIGSGDNAPQTGASAINTLKYPYFFGDNATYHFSFNNVPLSGDTLAIKFIGTPSQPITDESWGLDNVKVSAVPLPGAMLLLGVGLVRLAAYGRRKMKD